MKYITRQPSITDDIEILYNFTFEYRYYSYYYTHDVDNKVLMNRNVYDADNNELFINTIFNSY